MSTLLRCFAIVAAVVLAALLLTPISHAAASPQNGAPESMLLDAANHSRAAAGLPAVQWDAALAAAARQHAQRMAQYNTISHQFPGELPLQQRAMQTGARFSLIAENVAEGLTVLGLHTQWMNSPPHRANLLDREVNAVGIAVVQSGAQLFAVEDFSAAVALLGLDAQELQVGSQLTARGVRLLNATDMARKSCKMDRGWAGERPATVVRYETADLGHLPADLEQRVRGGKYRGAAVGACEAGGAGGFTRYRIAVLLY
jgi:Cysteine-rich secretory protein family